MRDSDGVDSKRGQLTIFIIIGMLILGLVLFAMAAGDDLMRTFGFGSSQKYLVETYVEDCLAKTTEYGLLLMGRYGGALEEGSAPLTRTPEQMRTDLGTFIDTKLPMCIKEFTPLEQQGISVTAQQPKANVRFTITNTEVQLDYPLQATKDGSTDRLDTFSVKIPVRFKTLYEAALEIKSAYPTNKGVDMTYLSTLDFNTEIYQLEESNVAVIFKDQRSKIAGKEYWFQFGFNSCTIDGNDHQACESHQPRQ